MTSSDDSLTVLKSAVLYLYQVGGPIIIFIGTIGALLNLSVFTQKNLRKNPCSIYFIAYNLANLIYIYSSLLALTLDVGYQIDPSAYNLPMCRLRIYIGLLFDCLSPSYLILAAIDRILITSRNALTRQKSTRRLAYICLAGGTLFWILFHSHALILSNIIQIGPNIFLCYFQQGVYLAFITYYSIVKQIVVLSSMIFCGLWSIKNIRSTRRITATNDLSATRIGGVTGNLQSTLSKDRQMVFMLLMDITIYASFSFLYVIYLIYEQITQNYVKSNDRIQIESNVQFLGLYSAAIPFCTSCYTNLIASKTFRKEVKKILSSKRICCILSE
jgi:RNase P subunit RPR2